MRALIAALLIAWLGLAYSATPDAARKDVIGIGKEKAEAHTAKPSTPTGANDSKPIPPTAQIATSPPKVNEKAAQTVQDGEPHGGGHDHWGNKSEFWLFITTIGLGVVTAILAAYTGSLYRATVDLSKNAEREFFSVNRPQIRIKHVWITGELLGGKPIEIGVAFVNTGLTRAIVTHTACEVKVLPIDAEWPARPTFKSPKDWEGRLDIPSGITADFPKFVASEPLTDHQNTRVRNGTFKLFCFGYVQYKDAEHRIRKTAFCRVLEPPTGGGASARPGTFVKFPHDDYEYQD